MFRWILTHFCLNYYFKCTLVTHLWPTTDMLKVSNAYMKDTIVTFSTAHYPTPPWLIFVIKSSTVTVDTGAAYTPAGHFWQLFTLYQNIFGHVKTHTYPYSYAWLRPDKLPGTSESWPVMRTVATSADTMQWKSSINCCPSRRESILLALVSYLGSHQMCFLTHHLI